MRLSVPPLKKILQPRCEYVYANELIRTPRLLSARTLLTRMGLIIDQPGLAEYTLAHNRVDWTREI